MANGTDSDKFVALSGVKVGMKRELRFALKSQSEICGSLGRTRSGKNPNGSTAKSNRCGNYQNGKRYKDSGFKEELKKRRIEKDEGMSDVVEPMKIDLAAEEEEAKSDVVDVEEVKVNLVESVKERFSDDAAVPMSVEVDSALVESGEQVFENEMVEGEEAKNEPAKVALKSEDDMRVEDQENGTELDSAYGKASKQEEKNVSELETVLSGKDEKEKGEKELVNENATESLSKEKTTLQCPKDSSALQQPISSGCNGKMVNVLVDKPFRRFTRSLLQSEAKTANIAVDIVLEETVNKVANDFGGKVMDVMTSSPAVIPLKQPKGRSLKAQGEKNEEEQAFHEEEMSEPCINGFTGSSQLTKFHYRDNRKAENGSVDKPLRRFTRSMLKHGVDDEKSVAKSDVQVTNAEDAANYIDGAEDVSGGSSSAATPLKVLRNFPTRVKDLINSGILEGLKVMYFRGLKSREDSVGLQGVIKGSGILCFCGACNGTRVVTPAVYESHACSLNKRPAEYIFLENGHSLRELMNACKQTPLATLEEALRTVIGPSMKKSNFCLNCRGSINEPSRMEGVILCNSCMGLIEPQKESPTRCAQMSKTYDAIDRSPEPDAGVTLMDTELKCKSLGFPRSSETDMSMKSVRSESKGSSSQSKSQGRITRKDLRLHKLVFEEDVLPDGTEVGYFVGGQKLLVGYKKGFGILCSCCNSVVSPSQFESHAGCAARRKPFQHIYTSNGVSLHELSVALSRERKFGANENDDLCSICADGGDLLCCDTCPRAFHPVCISLPSIPNGSWSCKYCRNMFVREKFVEYNVNALAAGRVVGVDAIEQITKRCIRIVNSLKSELMSVCVLCRGHSFSKSGFGPRTVIICDQCEKEFHVGCLKEHNIDDLQDLPEGQWFCGRECNRIHAALRKLIIRGEEKLPDSLVNLVKKKEDEDGSDLKASLDIRWRVLSGSLASSDDTKMLLSKAVSILHERFDPISESGSRGDLIPAMVYGREIKAQDFSGMHCVILTVNETVVSVGIFRIFGSEVAELPLVATSTEFQGQGYFQCLFACIERFLGFLNVRNLVLPAADEAKSIWTDKFGFSKMAEDELKEYRKDFPMMVFDGTWMLRKPVPNCQVISDPNKIAEDQRTADAN